MTPDGASPERDLRRSFVTRLRRSEGSAGRRAATAGVASQIARFLAQATEERALRAAIDTSARAGVAGEPDDDAPVDTPTAQR